MKFVKIKQKINKERRIEMKKKRFFKRMFAGVLAGAIGISACGCGNKQQAVKDEDPNTVPKDTYEINWYLPATAPKEIAVVENEINAYIKDKINATVKINCLENAQYSEKLSNMIMAGEYFDIAFCANWMLDYFVNAENGAFVELDSLFDKYMPKTHELSDKACLDCARVGGKVYALPVIKESASAYGWIYRKDLADKYNIDMSKIKTFEELIPVLKTIKENEPDIKYPINWALDQTPGDSALIPFNVITGYNVGYRRDDDSFSIMNKLDVPEIMDDFKLAHRFYKEGLVKEDILTNYSDTTQRLNNGQTFCALFPLKPGKVEETFGDSRYEFAQEFVTEARKGTTIGVSSMNAISSTSKNPARVARFLELLNTDKYLYNLVIYGIEGKHYTKVSDNVIKLIPNSGYDMSTNQWMIGNVYNAYTKDTENPDKYVELKNFDDSATVSAICGFRFVTEPVQAEIAACKAVEKQFETQIALGAIDPTTVIDEYRKNLETSGINKIIEEVQKQINEFLADKNK